MDKISEYLSIVIVAGLIGLLFTYVMWDNSKRADDQAIIIEQLQGDVRAMASAFEEIGLELLRVHTAYGSWSREIEKLRNARNEEIPEIGRWRNRKDLTKSDREISK